MSKEAMKLDDKAVAQILSRLPSPPVGDGSALHAWAMQVVRKLAEQSVPVQPDETLLSFYQATDFPSLVSAMNGHIKKMQSKLQSNPHTAIDAWNNREMVAVEHCIWARNGNTPCPHTSPQPAQQEPAIAAYWAVVDWDGKHIQVDQNTMQLEVYETKHHAKANVTSHTKARLVYISAAPQAQPAQQDRVRELECVIADLKAECKELRAKQPAQRKPLTDDELADLWFKQSLDWMEFARAIEAAHGIKE